jgi:hypothetical protein
MRSCFLFCECRVLTQKALLSVLLLGVVIAVILFITAGTVDYWQAWVFLADLDSPLAPNHDLSHQKTIRNS